MTAGLVGYAASFYTECQKRATVSTSLDGDNNDLTFTAVPPGTAGNSIAIIYSDPSANSQPLSISVANLTITVSLATGAGGAVTSTAQQVMDALNADQYASRWITAALATGDDGTGVVAAMGSLSLANGSTDTTESISDLSLTDLGDQKHWQAAAIADRYWVNGFQTIQKSKAATLDTDLVGDNNDLHFCAKTAGAGGNSVTVTYVDPGSPSQSLSIGVVGNDIAVNLATDGGSSIISTASEILTAINADVDAYALLKAYNKTGNDGSGVVTAMVQTGLSGGADYATVSSGITETSYLGLITFDTAIEEYDLVKVSTGTKHIMEAVYHAYDFEVSPEVDMKEVTVFGSEGHKEYLPGLQGGSGSVSDYWVTPGHSGDIGSNLIAVFYVNTDTGRHRIEADGYLKGAPVNASVGEVVQSKMEWIFTGSFYRWSDETY